MTPNPESNPQRASPARRRPWKGAIAAGVVALLVGVALTTRRPEEAPRPEVAKAAVARAEGPGAKATAAPVGSAGPARAEEPPPRFESTVCWRELERFNEAVTLDTFREWAAPLLASTDPLVQAYLKERLAELIGNDAGRASQVLGWVRDTASQDVSLYLAALRESQAVHLPQVSAQLADLALNGNLEEEKRVQVLVALDSQKRLKPAVLDSLADLAKDPGSGEAGWAATRTIARVMKKDLAQNGNIKPYLDKLLAIGTGSPDEQIRDLALTMPMHAAPVLDAEATGKFAKVLVTEGSEQGREAAAHNLALSTDKKRVLEIYANAFKTEQNLCVRWAIFRFAARAAGKDALPVMAEMAIVDPRFQPDYHVFESIYASGVVDFVRVWLSLPTQDPHGCLHKAHD
jgi:hypothetical protein